MKPITNLQYHSTNQLKIKESKNKSPSSTVIQSGFTIPELLISIFITVMIITVIVLVQNSVLSQQQSVASSYVTMNIANNSIQQMVKEIRNSQVGNNGAYLFEILDDYQIIFYSNIDQQEDIEKIHYHLDNNQLIKSVIKPTGYPIEYLESNTKTSVIADNVVNNQEPLFTYYNRDYPQDQVNNPLSPSTRLTQTRLIAINLLININPKILKQNYRIQSYAQIRTLKDNL